MSEHAPADSSHQDPPTSDSVAEAKRRAARRRFLGRSAAAGSGLVIVTLYHTRAVATYTTYREKLISSVEACNSLHGNLVKDYTGYPQKYDNSVTGIKDRYKCRY